MALLLPAVAGHAQTKKLDYSVVKPADWVVLKNDTLDYALEDYKGRPAFLLKRKVGNFKGASIAYPKSLLFKDGVIELDIAVPAGKDGFAGIAFRIRDDAHYETLYFRPGSSGTGYAIQYMPKKQQDFDWWHYEGLKYQAKAVLPLDDWFHVRAVVKGRTLKVYLNGAAKPVMVRNDLDPEITTGSVGFWLGNCSAGAYRNLTVEPLN